MQIAFNCLAQKEFCISPWITNSNWIKTALLGALTSNSPNDNIFQNVESNDNRVL